MATFRPLAILAVCGAMTQSLPALAASAVSYGNRTVSTASAPTSMKAAVQALENCSTRDSYCKLLLTCEERGAGAAALSQNNGFVQALGAVCGRPDASVARDMALQFCRDNGGSNCQIVAIWAD